MFVWLRSVYVVLILTSIVFSLGGCSKKPSWEKEIITEEILLPGLKEQYDFLFLTDTHIIASTENEPEEAYEGIWEKRDQYSTENGVYSVDQFPVWVAYANEKGVDSVLLGGDIIDSPGERNLEFLDEQFANLEVPYLYTPGNHDWTRPDEYRTEKAYNEFLPRLEKYMNGNTAIQKVDIGELRIIAVDNSDTQFDEQSVKEYEKYLQTDQKVIVLIHIPLITQSVLTRAREVWDSRVVLGGENYGGLLPEEFSRRFMDLTAAEDSPVELILAGHVHFYDKDYFVGGKDVLQIVGPAGFEGKAVHLTIKGTQ